ncbi:MAG: efflux RND transporter periplasmic adaptor subunit [Treponema sp.]|nr:efflux RND transporter periplasmic adaptor subunit [Treponema sp.]
MKTMKIILLSGLCSLFLFNFISCSKPASEEASAENGSLVQAVRVEKLVPGDLRKFIELNGNIRAEKSMNVYPVISGKIAGNSLHLGSQVKKGDVIAYIDPSLPGSRYALNEVTAPISGSIISIPLKEGSKVDTGTAVAVIGDLSNLQIITYIPERYVSFLKKGLEADLLLEAYPNEKFSALVSEVSPVLDEGSRTKEVILTFTKKDSRINAGMFANINLYLKEYRQVLSVPTSCIVEKNGEKYIYLIKDSGQSAKEVTAHLEKIICGEEIVNRTIITFADSFKSLSENTRLVIQGFENLQDGSRVNIAE